MASLKIQNFCVENSLPEGTCEKITSLFFEILLERTSINIENNNNANNTNNNDTNNTNNNSQVNEVKEINNNKSKVSKQMKSTTTNKWASKVASVYAEANNVKLEDFPEGSKITKSEILKFITDRNSPKDKNNKKILKLCSGTVKSGGMCNKVGCVVPEGAKNLYCQLHAPKWKIFENTEENNSDTETEDNDDPSDLPELVKDETPIEEPEKSLIEETEEPQETNQETEEPEELIEEPEETEEDKDLKLLNKELFGAESEDDNSDLEFDEDEVPDAEEQEFY